MHIFPNFLSSKPWIWVRIRIDKNAESGSVSGFALKTMQIRNTGFYSNYFLMALMKSFLS